MNEKINIVNQQIRECFGRVTYSHKTHEKCADIYIEKLNRVKNWQIILSALTTGTVLADLFNLLGLDVIGSVLAAMFAIALLALNTYSKSYNLGELVQKHRDTAIAIWKIREDYFSLLVDTEAEVLSLEQIVFRREELQQALESVYVSAPPTFKEAYKRAQKALQLEEELTFSDKEIDQFLPEILRKG